MFEQGKSLKTPGEPAGLFKETRCCQLNFCVCTGPGKQADFFHQNFIRWLKPLVVQPREKSKPKSKPAKAKAKPPKKKTPLRVLLEGGMLVVRLQPSLPTETEGSNDDGSNDKSPEACLARALAESESLALANSPWAEAAVGSTAVHGVPSDLQPFWFHISYVNFKTWEFTMLRLVHVDTYTEPENSQVEIYELEVQENPQVSTSRGFFAIFDLLLRWFTIISDDRVIPRDILLAKTVCVSETEVDGVHENCVWHGEWAENERRATQRGHAQPRNRKRTAGAESKRPSESRGSRSRRTLSSATGPALMLEDHEEQEQQDPAAPAIQIDEANEESEEEDPELDELVELVDTVDVSGVETEQDDQGERAEQMENAGMDLWDDFYEADAPPMEEPFVADPPPVPADSSAPVPAAPANQPFQQQSNHLKYPPPMHPV